MAGCGTVALIDSIKSTTGGALSHDPSSDAAKKEIQRRYLEQGGWAGMTLAGLGMTGLYAWVTSVAIRRGQAADSPPPVVGIAPVSDTPPPRPSGRPELRVVHGGKDAQR